ncbi:hypothetical protein SCHPADRAFT_910512 [Schizopora paradoxa]|uniref:Uncharacterized protein n=1 Tax=Schizopora paradoxa TaxID=27342 RepID=A0A0H2R301_9AGAM|nr:hypothetical protein SCHPADRAFT_910512 [Schizopora paradoxa]
MYDIDSKERQAHHLFMAMAPDNWKHIQNHELLGLAAAYHAACQFTDYVYLHGLPKTQVLAQTLIINYARAFIKTHIETRALALEKSKANQFAMASLRKRIHNPNPEAWRVNHMTLGKAFENWTEPEDPYDDSYERWGGDEYNYGRFGPGNHSNSRPASVFGGLLPVGRNDLPPPLVQAPAPAPPPVIPPRPQGSVVSNNRGMANPALPPFQLPPQPPVGAHAPPRNDMMFIDPNNVQQIYIAWKPQ